MQMPLIFWFQLLIMLVLKSRVAGFTSCFKATSYSFFAIGRLHATSFADLSSTLAKHTTQLFDLQLPEGRCVALELHPNDEESSLQNWSDPSHWVHQCLHPVEIEYGKHLTKTVRKSFLLGRLAMRVCLQHTEPCLKDLKGRPLLPKGQLGSISHKGLVGVALSTCVDGSTKPIAIGVDIEQHSSNKRSVASRILTKSEIQDLGRLKVSEKKFELPRFGFQDSR
jgi:4'-phosphopantetheinyl transferase EntD